MFVLFLRLLVFSFVFAGNLNVGRQATQPTATARLQRADDVARTQTMWTVESIIRPTHKRTHTHAHINNTSQLPHVTSRRQLNRGDGPTDPRVLPGRTRAARRQRIGGLNFVTLLCSLSLDSLGARMQNTYICNAYDFITSRKTRALTCVD